jgi:hypothetical protein
MRTAALTSFALVSLVLASTAAPAPSGWRRFLPTVSGNVAIAKERAERGEAKSQVELADNLAANQLTAQAVIWYRKAAEQGNVEAKFRLGEILINGATSPPDLDQRVTPKPVEGVLRMDLKQIQASHALTEQFLKRQWPHYVAPRISEADLALKLSGITIGPVSLAIINGQTLEVGDSVAMPTKDGTARVNCVKITQDSVLVAVEGEGEPRMLHIK